MRLTTTSGCYPSSTWSIFFINATYDPTVSSTRLVRPYGEIMIMRGHFVNSNQVKSGYVKIANK